MSESTVQAVRVRRATEEFKTKEEALEKKIRRVRQRIVKCDSEELIANILTPEVKRLKEQLFKLRGQWQEEFTHSKRKVTDSGGKDWYLIEAKYCASTMQEAICKSDGRWWSAGCAVESTDHRVVEKAVLDVFKKYWGI